MPTKRYEIIDWVGGGGEGNVFRATDRVSQQEVAIKVYGVRENPDVAGKSFKKEAGVLEKMKPRICPKLYDCGMTEDGCDYAVMEFLGKSLRQGIVKPQSRDSVERFAIQAINLLEQLHKAGTMHHDVKPQNIVFAKDQPGSNNNSSKRGNLCTRNNDNSSQLEQNIEHHLDMKCLLVDFGMSFPIDDNQKLDQDRAKARFCGSMDYSSRVSRMRVVPSRRDDMTPK